MTADDKKSIYNLLSTVCAWQQEGRLRNNQMPDFSNDAPFKMDADDKKIFQEARNELMTAPAHAEAAPAEYQKLADVYAAIRNCKKCNLCAYRKNVVPGMGAAVPAVMIVGEGPGADEDEQGLPFVGKAGQLLDNMLKAIGLSRTTNCYIANVVKCRPPKNRTPYPDEITACVGYLEDQIRLLKPKAVLAMGRTAAQGLLKTEVSITKMHGNTFAYSNDQSIPVVVTYHPSALLRDETLKRPAWNDLKLFKSLVEHEFPGLLTSDTV